MCARYATPLTTVPLTAAAGYAIVAVYLYNLAAQTPPPLASEDTITVIIPVTRPPWYR